MNIYYVIKKPLITEKSAILKETKNVVMIQVHPEANKCEIKEAVEKLFKVNVVNVKTANVAGKIKRFGRHTGKRSNWKKAYITLEEGSRVDFFEV
jgi:large subunit ribosomal protein L23